MSPSTAAVPATGPNPAPPTWVGRALRPGIRLMQNLRMGPKLALLTAVMAVPATVLLAVALAQHGQLRAQILTQAEGLAVARQVVPLMAEVQALRGLTHRTMSGDMVADAGREPVRVALRARLQELDAAVAARPAVGRPEEWQALSRRLMIAVDDAGPVADPAVRFGEFTALISDLERHARLVTHGSGLSPNDDPVASTLVQLALRRIPSMIELAGQARGLGSAALAAGSVAADERGRMLEGAGRLLLGADELLLAVEPLGSRPEAVPGSLPAARELAVAYARRIQAAFGHAARPDTADAFFEDGSALVQALVAVHDDAVVRLQHRLQEQADAQALHLGLLAAAGLIGAGVLAYLLACFTLSFHGALRALLRSVEAISIGDLAHQTDVRGRDELADIGHVVERMADQLSRLVAEIRNSATLVDQTGQQVSRGSAALAVRTDQQATHLRSSVGAISQLAAAVEHNAGSARRVDELTHRLSEQAAEGHEAMQQTLHAMGQMRRASERVAEVIAVIDDVAFQTGMLSLNASIEAARAGEAGRRFAVVAGDVRELAQRCAEAAEEIRALIGDAGTQVEVSSTRLNQAGTIFDLIVQGVVEVSGQLRQISSSSTEQSTGLQAVTESVGNLDEITRENAALVEESTTASHALVDRAGSLREAVATMQLRQGSADEARAMVERAVEHWRAVGGEQARVDFQDPAFGYVDRDMYLFGFDRQGIATIQSAKPALIGQSYSVLPGIDNHFIDRVWAAADDGGGWIQYNVNSPLTGAVTPKESYIVKVDENCAIGCGVYRNEKAGAARKAAAWAREKEGAATAFTD